MNKDHPADPSLEAELSKPAFATGKAPERLRADILRQVRSEWPQPRPSHSWTLIWACATAACACAIAILLIGPKNSKPGTIAAIPKIEPSIVSDQAEALTRPYTELYASVDEDLGELGNFLSGRVDFVGSLMPDADG